MPKIAWEKQPPAEPRPGPAMTGDEQWVGTSPVGAYRVVKGPDVPLGTAYRYFYELVTPDGARERCRSLAAAKAAAAADADIRRGRR